jgi:hypothetical protein
MRTMYVAAVEVETTSQVDMDDAMEKLADYYPAVVGMSPRGWVEVQVSFSASGLAHACTKAAAIARVATGAEGVACRVMTKLEYEARKGLIAGTTPRGRHAEYVENLGPLPRQATERWERARPDRGRHSS